MPSSPPSSLAPALAALHRGFRDRLVDYATLTAQVEAWAEAFPELVRLESLVTTPEGREQWLLTLGPEPERRRPGVWIDGNMHASELAGTSVCLAVAEDVLQLHLAPEEALHDLPPAVRAQLREVLFYVLPRVSPDGAEAVLDTGRFLRSVDRDERPNQAHPRWRAEDLDGDGLALLMRVPDPAGDFVESTEFPGLLVTREIEDEGPFYRVFSEGVIDRWDGTTIPEPSFLSDNDPDLNRNFPYTWASEPKQMGAGPHPGSAPESRALIEKATELPHLFVWLNLHTFGGVHIRPRGDAPDAKMDQGDLALFRQVEAWTDAFTGYPMVSGFEQFTYDPDTPLHGDLSDWAYHDRGCLAWVCELWDLFEKAGLPERKRFVDRYSHLDREHVLQLARWDEAHNEGRIVRPWKPVMHPQLGEVEVGGLDPRIGVWNPPPEELPGVCDGQSAVFLRCAALLPRLHLSLEATPLGEGTHAVTATLENRGYLGTFGIPSAKSRPFSESPHVSVEVVGGALASATDARADLGHLDGWGKGRFTGHGSVALQRSSGTRTRAQHRFVVTGGGEVRVRVESCRTGTVEATLQLG
ncbi:MAG: M14 family metallopeptidase [Myxococcota bacterium]